MVSVQLQASTALLLGRQPPVLDEPEGDLHNIQKRKQFASEGKRTKLFGRAARILGYYTD